MDSTLDLVLLQKLLTAAAPSGFEERAAQVFLEEARTFADQVYSDFYGNVYAEINPDAGQLFVLEAHIDEIGVMVSHVSDEGFIYCQEIGGMDNQTYVGQRIRLLAEDGNLENDLIAFVGKKPIHLLSSDDRSKVSKLSELYLDTGLEPAETLERVKVGRVGVLEQPPMFVGNKVVSRALDNRASVFAVLQTLRRLKAAGCSKRVVVVGAVQEEVGLHGAKIAAHRLDALHSIVGAIVLDVTFETSQPDIDIKKLGRSPFNSGANLCVMPILHQASRKALEQTAKTHHIPYTVSTGPSISKSYTDADVVTLARAGVPTALIGIPCRYMHSPNEMVDLRDIEACVALITAHLLAEG